MPKGQLSKSPAMTRSENTEKCTKCNLSSIWFLLKLNAKIRWETVDAFFLHFGTRLFVFEIALPWNLQLRSAASRSDSLGHALACFGHMAKTNNQRGLASTDEGVAQSSLHHDFLIKILQNNKTYADQPAVLYLGTGTVPLPWQGSSESWAHMDWLRLALSLQIKCQVTWSLSVVCSVSR